MDRPGAGSTAQATGTARRGQVRTSRSPLLRLVSMPPLPHVEADRPRPGTHDVTLPAGVQEGEVDAKRIYHSPGSESGAGTPPERANPVPDSTLVAEQPPTKAEERPLVLILLKKPAALDPTGPDFKHVTGEKRLAEEKQIAAAGILHLPKPVLAPSVRFGWRPSPLFAWARRMKRPNDGSIDPRAWKKWLAHAHQELVREDKLPPEMVSPEAKELLYQRVVELKRQAMQAQKKSDDPSVTGS
jgi:hypothetical protein